MEVLKYGNLKLKEISNEVTEFNDELRHHADEMYETMIQENGIGLAAPQVGLLIRLIVIEIDEEQGRVDLVNPVIVDNIAELEEGEEGCLSVPGLYAKVDRYREITVTAQDLHGKEIHFQADGLFARVIQHESDHLDGVLFIDRLKKLDKLDIKSELKKIKKKYNPVLA